MGLEQRQAPRLRLVGSEDFQQEKPLFDSVTRDAHLQRIRYLARAYDLRWLVEQATFDRPGIDNLGDQEIVALHSDLDRAMECRRDGVSFEDAGLVRPISGEHHHDDDVDSWGNGDCRLAG